MLGNEIGKKGFEGIARKGYRKILKTSYGSQIDEAVALGELVSGAHRTMACEADIEAVREDITTGAGRAEGCQDAEW